MAKIEYGVKPDIFKITKETKGRDNQYSPCFCEGVAGLRPPTPSH